jgi:hypothetical protein
MEQSEQEDCHPRGDFKPDRNLASRSSHPALDSRPYGRPLIRPAQPMDSTTRLAA